MCNQCTVVIDRIYDTLYLLTVLQYRSRRYVVLLIFRYSLEVFNRLYFKNQNNFLILVRNIQQIHKAENKAKPKFPPQVAFGDTILL